MRRGDTRTLIPRPRIAALLGRSPVVLLEAPGGYGKSTTARQLAATLDRPLVRAVLPGPSHAAAHVYPIYSNMRLIRLVDFQPIIAAILLFQYDRLVSKIISELKQMDLTNKKVLITSCAFGNVIPRDATRTKLSAI